MKVIITPLLLLGRELTGKANLGRAFYLEVVFRTHFKIKFKTFLV